jgi:hypothetical protein
MLISGDSLADGDSGSSVVVDGSTVWYSNRSHGHDDALDEWLDGQAGVFHTVKHPWPFYVLATNRTRLGLIRRVEQILRALGGVRLGVRPAIVMEPWPPRADRKAFFAHKTRTVPPGECKERDRELVQSVFVAAEGCPEAAELFDQLFTFPGDRLSRVPDVFEKCSCKGDMDTTAALLWFMALENQVPIRWHPWDEELVRSMGDDATYAELARVLTERYVAARQP